MSYNANMTQKTGNKTPKKKNKVTTKIVSIILIIAAIWMLAGVGKEIFTTLQLQKQARDVADQLQLLKDENATLIQKRDKLEDPNYVETYARGEYMFSKEDEKVFYLPSGNNNSSEEANE